MSKIRFFLVFWETSEKLFSVFFDLLDFDQTKKKPLAKKKSAGKTSWPGMSRRQRVVMQTSMPSKRSRRLGAFFSGKYGFNKAPY